MKEITTVEQHLIDADRREHEALPLDVAPVTPPARATPRWPTDVLDPRALADVREMDQDGSLVHGIIRLYLEDGARLLAAVADAHATHDIDALAFATHTLKSSSGCVGARDVTARCERIETEARARRTACPSTDIAQLSMAFHTACSALLAVLNDVGAREPEAAP